MTRKVLPPWKKGDPITAARLEDMQRVLQRLDRSVGGTGIDEFNSDSFSGRTATSNGPHLRYVRLTSAIGLSPDESTDGNGTAAMQEVGGSGAWSDSGETLDNVFSESPVPYDSNYEGWFIYHNGRYFPLSHSTVRHAITVDPEIGSYPDAESLADTFPIKFVRLSFTEAAGAQGHSITFLDTSTTDPDRYLQNLYRGPEGWYIPVGSLIWCYWVENGTEHGGQWFTFVVGETDAESSSSDLSEEVSESLSASESASVSVSESSQPCIDEINGILLAELTVAAEEDVAYVLVLDHAGCLALRPVTSCDEEESSS